jgi:hypothetical protein
MLDVPANGHVTIDPHATPKVAARLAVQPAEGGAKLAFDGKDLGTLSWSLVLHKVPAATAKNDAASSGRPAEFAPQALKLEFARSGGNVLFTTYSATTSAAGLEVKVDLDAYPAGFLDVRTTVTNRSAPTRGVYAAVLTRWEQPGVTGRTCDYNGAVSELKESTPWRKPGDRHQFVGRGLNWVIDAVPGGNVLWLNQFAPSFTVHRGATAKAPAQWVGANSPQLDQEAYVEGDALVHVTELAHGSVKSYRSRLDDYVLPDASQPLSFTHRLVFSDRPFVNEEATDAFVAYTSYNSQHGSTVDLGAGAVTFGTAYFPYSTLGENFLKFKLPGMSQDSYWPLAADVVKHYMLFADDIRRDMRIAKAMGFQSLRLHHLEMLWTTDKDPVQVSEEERTAFLDFYFGELKHLGMTALLDVKLKPEQIAELVKRYRPLVDGVEIDNEVLIFGIKDEDIPYWKQCYAAVKSVAPDMPVHWTAHTNTSAFKRLDAEGVPYDRIGQHAYADGVDAIPLTRDFALQVANFASAVNKPPVITEWNWRFLTRMTEAERAKVYAPIFENVLKAHAMPEIYQFQFNDSLAMNPVSLKGIRHYELLNLSRRPKEEAKEFQRLVDTYSAPDSTTRSVKADRQVTTFKDGKASATFTVTNTSGKPLHLTATCEAPDNVKWDLSHLSEEPIAPGGTTGVDVSLTLPQSALPGFYHAFVRLEDKDAHVLRYAWLEARNPGQPVFDKTTHPGITASEDAFDLDLTKPTAVVYGDDCPVMELEAAWVVYQTLEAATGVPVQIYTASALPKEGVTNVIYVGTGKSLKRAVPAGQAITRVAGSNALVISGPTSQEATVAAMDYVLRYWKTAKDAACRRVPLVEREIAKGGDAGQLP